MLNSISRKDCKLLSECESLKLNKRQILTVVKTFVRLKRARRLLIIAGTGYGKTYTFLCTLILLKKFNLMTTKGKVLIVSNRLILIDQINAEFSRILTGLSLKNIRSNDNEFVEFNQITIQTYISLKENEEYVPPFDLVIIDEVHVAGSTSYVKFINDVTSQNPNCIILGYTATPTRGDSIPLMNMFDEIADNVQLGDLVDRGLLTRCKLYSKSMPDDFLFYHRLYDYYKEVRKEVGKKLKTIIYCSSIQECYKLYELIHPYEKVAIVHCHLLDVSSFIQDFKNGVYDILINVRILVEGFDCPEVNCIVISKAVNHLGTLIQMVGRGARLYAGKTEYYCLDFKDNFKHYKPEEINFLEHMAKHSDVISMDEFVKQRNKGKLYGFLDCEYNNKVKNCPSCDTVLTKVYCPTCLFKFLGLSNRSVVPEYDRSGFIVGNEQVKFDNDSKPAKGSRFLMSKLLDEETYTKVHRIINLAMLSEEPYRRFIVYNDMFTDVKVYIYLEKVENYNVWVIAKDYEIGLYTIVEQLKEGELLTPSIKRLLQVIDISYMRISDRVMKSRDKRMTEKIERDLSCFDLNSKSVRILVVEYSQVLFKVTKFMKKLLME